MNGRICSPSGKIRCRESAVFPIAEKYYIWRMKRILYTLLVFVLASTFVWAQDRPFAKDIRKFKAADSVRMPPKNAIVFVGSSSFTLWTDVQEDFPGHKVINRGFGGSSLPHLIAYADEIIIPYKPKQIVIYCGENDFGGENVTSDTVVNRFKTLFGMLREELPRAEILYVSMKPSPSRRHLMPQFKVANAAIRDFISQQRRAKYIDIWDVMVDNGEPRPELFVKDMLHMNEKGYALWQEAIGPHLK